MFRHERRLAALETCQRNTRRARRRRSAAAFIDFIIIRSHLNLIFVVIDDRTRFELAFDGRSPIGLRKQERMKSLSRRMECERALTGRTTFHTLIARTTPENCCLGGERFGNCCAITNALRLRLHFHLLFDSEVKKTNKMWVKWLCKATLWLFVAAFFCCSLPNQSSHKLSSHKTADSHGRLRRIKR